MDYSKRTWEDWYKAFETIAQRDRERAGENIVKFVNNFQRTPALELAVKKWFEF